jgi:glycosyltransferase involved in cell wall biosynthesis
MSTIKLSIITVTFNNISGLKRTYESIKKLLNSSNLEWIIIDGDSNDGTQDYIIQLYRDISILKFVSEKDSGIYDAMNKGISYSSGDFLWFLNSGDLSLIDTLQNLNFESFKEINVFNINSLNGRLESINWSGVKDNLELLKDFPCIPHQSTIIKKSLFINYGLYDLKFKLVADYEKFCLFYSKKVEFKFYLNLHLAEFVYDGVSSNFKNSKSLYKEISYVQKNFFGKKSYKAFLYYNLKYLLSLFFNQAIIEKLRPYLFQYK